MTQGDPDTRADAPAGAPPDMEAVLAAGGPGPGGRRLRLGLAAVALVVLALGAAAFLRKGDADGLRYTTAPAGRGDLTVTVTATGTLEPLTQVEVGTEVSGTVEAVLVDFNDRVKVGQVLLRLDTARLNAQALQAEAAVKSARAHLLDSQATARETQAELARLQHVRELSGGKVPSQQEMDAAQASLDRARAAVGTAEAQIAEAEAALSVDQTNLAKAVIRSPIDGIVLDRKVEPGQTVAASLQTPVLFVLAENLTQMELHVAVDEADVGRVRPGQQATFGVDAYPDRTFPATITAVRFAPKTVEGVVTYETLLKVDNRDLALRPGMTATADVTVDDRKGVLLIPNAALRFSPPRTGQEQDDRSFVTRLIMPFHRGGDRHPSVDGEALPQRVWVLEGGRPAPVRIRVGASDGTRSEVLEGDLKDGAPLIVDAVPPGARRPAG